jgi:glycosyltransferase involved in cell wall biosynthesis
MVMVLGEPAIRADLSRRALARAARFSWRRTAEQTIDAYCEVLAGALALA